MKLGNAHIVARLAVARDALVHERAQGIIRVAIDGTMQDDAMSVAVRDAVAAELGRRIVEIDADLAALGVDVDVEPA